MLFHKYKSKFSYYGIAEEISKMSREMSKSLVQDIIVPDSDLRSELDDSTTIFENNFYAYGIICMREIILYKLDLPEPDKEVEAMIDTFSKLKGMKSVFYKGMILDNSSVVFKNNVTKELITQLSSVLGPYATPDLFDGYFKAIDMCVTEWLQKTRGEE